jgi:hypothetical protein
MFEHRYILPRCKHFLSFPNIKTGLPTLKTNPSPTPFLSLAPHQYYPLPLAAIPPNAFLLTHQTPIP